jgi:hypothetical protein
MKTYIYFHICCINNWLKIVIDIINDIKKSGLYIIIDEIRCFILGDFNVNLIPEIFNDPKIKICNVHPNIHLYEKFTLWSLYDDSLKEDFNVLYLHSKGIGHNSKPNIIDWVDYLIYFNVYKFKNILEYLTTYDTVGVNFAQDRPHYSGNFWWSKSSHIKTLNRNIGNSYWDAEFWVTSKTTNYKALSLYQSKVNHYNERYVAKNYIDKDFQIETYEII